MNAGIAKASSERFGDGFRKLLLRTQQEVNRHLEKVLAESLALAKKTHPDAVPMVGAIASLSGRGGKRLRPALARVGAIAAGADLSPSLRASFGASLELLQAYFLIHDDWMDQDDERRGGPTAHVTLEKRFGSTHLGACSAVLAGDFALARATDILAKSAVPNDRLAEVLSVFAEMQMAAVLGQQLDIVSGAKDPELVYELKTASYTVRGPLALGAAAVGASKATKRALDAFSIPAGVAFQLRDDLIGVFGDPSVTGKPRGADLTAGKNTSLVRLALKTKGEEKKALANVFGVRTAKQSDVEKAIVFLETSRARMLVEKRIAALSEEALSALSSRAIAPKGRLFLEGALRALAFRSM